MPRKEELKQYYLDEVYDENKLPPYVSIGRAIPGEYNSRLSDLVDRDWLPISPRADYSTDEHIPMVVISNLDSDRAAAGTRIVKKEPLNNWEAFIRLENKIGSTNPEAYDFDVFCELRCYLCLLDLDTIDDDIPDIREVCEQTAHAYEIGVEYEVDSVIDAIFETVSSLKSKAENREVEELLEDSKEV